jgi:hypothetical protein
MTEKRCGAPDIACLTLRHGGVRRHRRSRSSEYSASIVTIARNAARAKHLYKRFAEPLAMDGFRLASLF